MDKQEALDIVEGAMMFVADEADLSEVPDPEDAGRNMLDELGELKAYINETTAELERVRAGFRAMTVEFVSDECPCYAGELRGEQMAEFGCPADPYDDEGGEDCDRGTYDCWERLFIARGNAT